MKTILRPTRVINISDLLAEQDRLDLLKRKKDGRKNTKRGT